LLLRVQREPLRGRGSAGSTLERARRDVLPAEYALRAARELRGRWRAHDRRDRTLSSIDMWSSTDVTSVPSDVCFEAKSTSVAQVLPRRAAERRRAARRALACTSHVAVDRCDAHPSQREILTHPVASPFHGASWARAAWRSGGPQPQDRAGRESLRDGPDITPHAREIPRREPTHQRSDAAAQRLRPTPVSRRRRTRFQSQRNANLVWCRCPCCERRAPRRTRRGVSGRTRQPWRASAPPPVTRRSRIVHAALACSRISLRLLGIAFATPEGCDPSFW